MLYTYVISFSPVMALRGRRFPSSVSERLRSNRHTYKVRDIALILLFS